MDFYTYWRSSAAYRLRIAFNLKGIAVSPVQINLHPEASEQKGSAYRAKNPQGRVPAIEVGSEIIGQSMAILEWLEETYPEPAILPKDPVERLRAREFADIIACDIHPLNNLSVLSVLREQFGADKEAIERWYSDWIIRGFTALEVLAERQSGEFLFGAAPMIAEICLIPQIYNARRFDVDLAPFPRLLDLDQACSKLPAFQAATPEAVKPD